MAIVRLNLEEHLLIGARDKNQHNKRAHVSFSVFNESGRSVTNTLISSIYSDRFGVQIDIRDEWRGATLS